MALRERETTDAEATVPATRRVAPSSPEWWAGQGRLLHWATLVVAFFFLLRVDRHQWFDVDEWAMLVHRQVVGDATHLGLWSPHNEHWSTVITLLYRSLFTVFGVRTYLPYLVMLVLAHLALVHLLWRLCLRVGVQPLLATLAVAPFAVLGSGWENLTLPFQTSLILSLVCGVGALLVVPSSGPFRRDDAWGAALLVLGLMSSGVGVTMVVVVTLVALLQRGAKVALLTALGPGFVYLVWYALQGRKAVGTAGTEPFTSAIHDVPAYIWHGLREAADGVTGLDEAGAVVLGLLVVWALRSQATRGARAVPALAAALGSMVFLGLTAIRRSGLGIDLAASPRYIYVVAALLLPLAALAVQHLLARVGDARVALVVMAVATAWLVLVQSSTLIQNADGNGLRKQEQKHRVMAAAELLEDGEEYVSAVPVPVYMPDLDVTTLRRLARDGDLPGNVRVTPEDRLTARAYLQLAVGDDTSPAGLAAQLLDTTEVASSPGRAPGCLLLDPLGASPALRLRIQRGDAVLVRSGLGTPFNVVVENPVTGATSRARPVGVVTPAFVRITSVVPAALVVRLALSPAVTSEVCGLG